MKHTGTSLNQQLANSHKLWSTFDIWQDSENAAYKKYFLSGLLLALGNQRIQHIDVQASVTGNGVISVRLFTETSLIKADADLQNPVARVTIVARSSLRAIEFVKFPYVAADDLGGPGKFLINLRYRDLAPLQLGDNFQRSENYRQLQEFHDALVSDLS